MAAEGAGPRPSRRRWRWLVAAALLGALGAVAAWWLQRQATDVAAAILTRALAEAPGPPEVPRWPLDAPFVAVAGAAPFPFAPERPTLVVLLHGMSPSIDLDERVGSHAYARHYWGHAFVQALLGDGALEDAHGTRLERSGWSTGAPPGSEPRDALVLPSGGSDAPRRGALLVTRDASLGLGAQTTAAGRQVDAGIDAFEALTGEPVQVVLIGHSMGGLVARHLLTNPPLDDGPFGVDTATRAAIERVRGRTLFLVTLGTPHEGSQAADRAGLLATVERIVVDDLVRPNAFARRWLLPLVEQTKTLLRLEDPATEHLRSDVWAILNDPSDGLLAAHRVRRGDGSVVPVYALASRSPGGRFFVDPLVSDRIELELALWYAESLGLDPEAYVEATLQMLLADPTMHTLGLPERGWGRAADHPAPAEVLDLVTRVPTAPDRVFFGPEGARVTIELGSRVDFLRGPHAGEVPTRGPVERYWCLLVRCAEVPFVVEVGTVADVDLTAVDEPTVERLRDLVLGRDGATGAAEPGAGAGRIGDGEIDADGVVPVDSALGLLLGADTWPYLAAGRDWRVGAETLPGSWYRPDLDEPTAERPWTYLHHIDLQYDPAVARWIRDTLLDAAGPRAGPLPISAWD